MTQCPNLHNWILELIFFVYLNLSVLKRVVKRPHAKQVMLRTSKGAQGSRQQRGARACMWG
jgi:hypothetical protein